MIPSIPLVPRRPKSGEPGTGKGKDKKSEKKKDKTADADKPDTPVAPSDPDEKVRHNKAWVYVCQVACFGGLIITFGNNSTSKKFWVGATILFHKTP